MKGHFENGAWIPPTCARCGKCCEYLWFRNGADEEFKKFQELHEGIKIVGTVLWVYAPCQYFFKTFDSEGIFEHAVCYVHGTDEQPECCKRFGPGNYYHPPECAFANEDELNYVE